MTVRCRPFYLPRELTVVIFTAVYIPPDANISTALAYLHITINKKFKAYPDGAHIITGDFNKACLKTVFPEFTQYVTCATRGNITLDPVYSNLKHAYKAVSLPHLGLSDHLSLFLMPGYTPLRRKTKPEIKLIKIWPEGALDQLQDCFSNTNWNLFEQEDLEEYTKTVLFYILTCVDIVSVKSASRFFQTRSSG
uniref:Endonuclease/exonuclease/phosphatase domain-containing protein n=1 Tax=Micrurus lemniscatus lemniscatus TaxID=129467 RepID=A0A2D4HU70_MICLE